MANFDGFTQIALVEIYQVFQNRMIVSIVEQYLVYYGRSVSTNAFVKFWNILGVDWFLID